MVRERLRMPNAVEAYVYNSPEMQAHCSGGSDESVFVLLSSALVRHLDKDEICFVLGHEIGHFLFRHHEYPRIEANQSNHVPLNLLYLFRAGEISADRVGYLACHSRDSVFRAILKTASGLAGDHLRFDFTAYLDQQKQLEAIGGSECELVSTHPMFTVRLRSLLWFEMSELLQRWNGSNRCSSISTELLERRVERELAAATGFRMTRANEKAARDVMLWGTVSLFLSDKNLSKAEQTMLRVSFGQKLADKVIDFVRHQGPDGAFERLEASLTAARFTSAELRQEIWNQLKQTAQAAGGTPEQQERVLFVIRDRMHLAPSADEPA